MVKVAVFSRSRRSGCGRRRVRRLWRRGRRRSRTALGSRHRCGKRDRLGFGSRAELHVLHVHLALALRMLHEFVELLSRLGDRGRLEVEYEGRSKLHRSSQRRYRKRHGPYRGEQRAAFVGDVRRVGADGCGRLELLQLFAGEREDDAAESGARDRTVHMGHGWQLVYIVVCRAMSASSWRAARRASLSSGWAVMSRSVTTVLRSSARTSPAGPRRCPPLIASQCSTTSGTRSHDERAFSHEDARFVSTRGTCLKGA
jgi:hypothetical protein